MVAEFADRTIPIANAVRPQYAPPILKGRALNFWEAYVKNLYFRRALLATALIASPALAGLPPVEYVGPGWYVWVSGVYEDGTEYRNPADGAFSEKSACLTKRDEWIAGDIKANPDKPSKNKYSCTYHDKDWYDDPNYDDVL